MHATDALTAQQVRLRAGRQACHHLHQTAPCDVDRAQALHLSRRVAAREHLPQQRAGRKMFTCASALAHAMIWWWWQRAWQRVVVQLAHLALRALTPPSTLRPHLRGVAAQRGQLPHSCVDQGGEVGPARAAGDDGAESARVETRARCGLQVCARAAAAAGQHRHSAAANPCCQPCRRIGVRDQSPGMPRKRVHTLLTPRRTHLPTTTPRGRAPAQRGP